MEVSVVFATVADNLAGSVEQLKLFCKDLFEKHASVHNEPTRSEGGQFRMTPWGPERTGGMVIVGFSIWNPLSVEGTRVQAAALKKYQEFAGLARILLSEQPQTVLNSFNEQDRIALHAIHQQGTPHAADAVGVMRLVEAALERQLSLVSSLYDGSDKNTVIVPDTNALLFNPNLEDWDFDDVNQFTLILLPTILKELDKLKTTPREDFRKKVESLITRIKGYRGRGLLNEGVPLRKGKSVLRSLAAEPNMTSTLTWLDPSNDDDRFLASFLEVMRSYVHSRVVLVTRDINLQNKAELARVPFREPPEPLAKKDD
jgi:hypothetical protein